MVLLTCEDPFFILIYHFVNALTRKSTIYHVSIGLLSWKILNTRYRDSQFFKTDFDSFDTDDLNKQYNNSTQSDEAICDMEEENGRQNVIYSKLFQKQWPKKTASTSCRYLLKQIKDHTYIVNDKNVLKEVEERLEMILQIMKSHCPSDFGFLVKSSLEKLVHEKRSNSNYEKLPHPRLWKPKFIGRVDRSNESRKFHSKITLAEDKTPLPECIEEAIPADDNAFYDIKFEETGDQLMHSNNFLDEENRDTKHLSLKKSLMMLMSIRISRMTVF